jgi:hypothetical protein
MAELKSTLDTLDGSADVDLYNFIPDSCSRFLFEFNK